MNLRSTGSEKKFPNLVKGILNLSPDSSMRFIAIKKSLQEGSKDSPVGPRKRASASPIGNFRINVLFLFQSRAVLPRREVQERPLP